MGQGAMGSRVRYLAELEEFEKRRDPNREKRSALIGGGTVATGLGLTASGLPVREPNVDPLKGSPYRPRNIARLANMGRGGILGYRAAAHERYTNGEQFWANTEKDVPVRPNTAYRRGYRGGKIEAEHEVLRGLRMGRKAGFGLTAAGLGAIGVGARQKQQRKKQVGKRDDRRRGAYGAALGAGGVAAVGGHAVPRYLDRFGRRYEASAKDNVRRAHQLAPNFGGLALGRSAKETMYPARTDEQLRNSQAQRRIKDVKTRAEVGRLRGIAAQHRHFVEAFDDTAHLVRRLRTPGLVASGVGATGLYAGRKKKPVSKMGERFAVRYTNALTGAAERARPKAPAGPVKAGRKGRLVPRARLAAANQLDAAAVDGTRVLRPVEELVKREPAKQRSDRSRLAHGAALGAGVGYLGSSLGADVVEGYKGRMIGGIGRTGALVGAAGATALVAQANKNRRKRLAKSFVPGQGLGGIVGKGDDAPLKTHMSERDAKRVTSRYGLAGELPKTLTREQKMGAYEARYVASGGRKGEKWQRRAERADKVKNVGLGVATAGGAAYLAGKTKRLPARLTSPKARSVADSIAIGGATAGGAGELYGYRARRKRSSYASAPGGVAASALRRMRAMDAAKGQS